MVRSSEAEQAENSQMDLRSSAFGLRGMAARLPQGCRRARRQPERRRIPGGRSQGPSGTIVAIAETKRAGTRPRPRAGRSPMIAPRSQRLLKRPDPGRRRARVTAAAPPTSAWRPPWGRRSTWTPAGPAGRGRPSTLAGLAVLTVVLFVAGFQKNAQITACARHGVSRCTVTVTGVPRPAGGEWQQPGRLRLHGHLHLDGHRYREVHPGQRPSPRRVRGPGVTVPGDPPLLSTPGHRGARAGVVDVSSSSRSSCWSSSWSPSWRSSLRDRRRRRRAPAVAAGRTRCLPRCPESDPEDRRRRRRADRRPTADARRPAAGRHAKPGGR